MAGLLGFTLADLSGAVDSRKRQYANLVRGLLSDPGATLAQLAAVDAEAARGNRYTQMSAGSVMPEVAQQGQEAMLNAALNVGGLLGITAYHGSPHTFDKFDMSKIGTGEGAQAYGHGLYFAENPAVADSYRAAGNSAPAGVNQTTVAVVKNWLEEAKSSGLTGDTATKWAKEQIFERAKNTSSSHLRQTMYDAMNNFDNIAAGKYGSTYKVDIPDEAVAKMLDWDKPLSQQPEAVRKALKKGNYAAADDKSINGGEFYRRLLQESGANQDEISAALLADGIPGIRYLDGNSRTTSFAARDSGTRNFVLFDDKLLKILSRE